MFFIVDIERDRLKEGRWEERWRGEKIRELMKGRFLVIRNWREEEMEREIGREREREGGGEGGEEKAVVFRGKWEGC